MKLGKSVVVKASAKMQLAPGQRWVNKHEMLTLIKKYDGRYWLFKDKFGDQKKMETSDLFKKIETDKLKLESKKSSSDFIGEILPIAKRYFNPLMSGLLLSGIKKIIGENEHQKTVSSADIDKSIDAGQKQNEALGILTDIYSELNILTRETFLAAPNEIRVKSVQATNEVRELLDLVVSMLPPIK